ncbi:MAG: M24 family metallopeptidase [Collinsella sp.]
MAHVDDQRVARVLDALEAQHPGAQLLVNDPWSIYYLTGFYADMFERFCGVLLARGAEPVILVNALHQLPEYDNARVAYHTDTDIVADAIAREVDPTKPLGIDTVMRSGFLMPLMERHAASEFFLGDFAVTAARTHKDAAEQELMRVSSAANDAVMADAIKLVHEGVTEREIADQMLGLYRKHGCEGFSFPPIVSFGANAGDPHHEPDDTVLKHGDVVLFDIGGRHRNYCSDMTRTFFWGEPDEETARIYDIVRRANEAAEALIAPGVRMCDLDRAARDVIEDAGYGKYFTHRLGHSIGLQDHEPGDVSLVNEQVVKPGMTFSIEPGIYLPGRTGVRIEDLGPSDRVRRRDSQRLPPRSCPPRLGNAAKGLPFAASHQYRATKTAYLLRLTRMGRPYPRFYKIRKPSTCGFAFTMFRVVEGSRSNVVDRPISWQASRLGAQGSQKAPSQIGCF